jgi:hypothetical protein
VANNITATSIGGTNVTVYGPGSLNLFGGAMDIAGSPFKLRPPKVLNSTAKAGDILTLTSTDGTADWQTPLTAPNIDTSIYNNDGTLTANRTLTGGGRSLLFTGLNDFSVASTTMGLQGTTRISLKTPGFATRQGQFLQLTDQSLGTVEFASVPVVNLYNTDGALTGNRIVTQGANNLTFTGSGLFTTSGHSNHSINAANININGSVQLHLESAGHIDLATPNIRNTTATAGQVLTLMDPDVGRVEYATPAADTSIYKNDGSLTGNRIVSLGNQTLTFQGFGNIAHNSLGTFDVSAVSRAKLQSSGEMEIGGQSVLRIRTPKVQNGTVTLGQVLTLTNLDGSVEFQSTAGGVTSPLQFESKLTDTSTAVNPTTLWFGVGTLNPLYTGASPEPVNGTRLVGRLTRPNAPGGWANTGSGGVSLNFPLNPGSGGDHTYERNILKPDGGEIEANVLKEGTAVDLVFFRAWNGTGTPGKWIMLNAGYSGLTLQNAAFSLTNSVSRKVTLVSFAGVVDTFADLADLPISLKKVSTLGNLVVGDHGHGDYYLTAWDPTVSGSVSVRSSVDPAMMWRRLQ